MFFVTLSIVVVIAGLVSLWDPLEMRQTLTGVQVVGFVLLVGGCDFALCYAGGFLVLYLVRFRSKFQAVLVFILDAVILAGPCTVVFYGGYSMFHRGMAPHVGMRIIYSVAVVSALWASALIAYVLVLRLDRRDARAPRHTEPVEGALPGEGHADSLTTPVGSDGGAVGAPEPIATAEETSSESRPAEAPTSDAVSQSSCVRTAGLDELGNDGADGTGIGSVERDAGVPEQLGSHALEALNGDVVYVQVSGHYIDVVTSRGSTVLQMRLTDAVTVLGARGMQTHRSYWVSFRHMRRLVRRDHRTMVRLSDGQEVPVSRQYVRSVRERISDSPDQQSTRRDARA